MSAPPFTRQTFNTGNRELNQLTKNIECRAAEPEGAGCFQATKFDKQHQQDMICAPPSPPHTHTREAVLSNLEQGTE